MSAVRGGGRPNLNDHENNPISEYRKDYGRGWTSNNMKQGYYEFAFVTDER